MPTLYSQLKEHARRSKLGCVIVSATFLMIVPLVLGASISASAQQCAPLQQCGDVDASGDVQASDALRVLREAVGLPQALVCECGLDSENWSWSDAVIGNDPAKTILLVPVGIQLQLTDVHGTSNAGSGSELRISDDSGLRYVRALSTQPFDVVFDTALVFDAETTVTVQTTGGTTQLTLSGLLTPAP